MNSKIIIRNVQPGDDKAVWKALRLNIPLAIFNGLVMTRQCGKWLKHWAYWSGFISMV